MTRREHCHWVGTYSERLETITEVHHWRWWEVEASGSKCQIERNARRRPSHSSIDYIFSINRHKWN